MNPGLPQQDPTWNSPPSAYPAGYGPPPQQTPPPRGRWIVAVVIAITALITATATAITTVEVRGDMSSSATSPPPITVTVTAPTHTAQPPIPLPTAEADHQTCQDGWIAAGRLIDSSNAALDALPPGMRINDPAIATNSEWMAAVRRAGDLQQQAADALDAQITPGATPILASAATAAVQAMSATAYAITHIDPHSGDVGKISNASAAEMAALCRRLAPL